MVDMVLFLAQWAEFARVLAVFEFAFILACAAHPDLCGDEFNAGVDRDLGQARAVSALIAPGSSLRMVAQGSHHN